MIVTLPDEYPYVMLLSIAIAFQCFLFGFIAVGPKRSKFFTKEFMKKNFGEEHAKAFPNNPNPPKGGYPDTGSGLYAKKLGYKEWFELNIAQRIHGNFVD